MTNFFYSDKFYSDLGELMDDLNYLYEPHEVDNLPDDYSIDCIVGKLETIITLSAEWISERIDEERFSEDGDEIEKIEKVLSNNINFEDINKLLPKLHYEGIDKFKITKADMMEWIK